MHSDDVTRRLDRRQFLRRAGGAGALLTVPAWLAACGSDDDSGGGGGGGGGGETIKIGYVTPQTGALAAFAAADNFTLTTIRDLVASTASRSSSRTRSPTRTAPEPSQAI